MKVFAENLIPVIRTFDPQTHSKQLTYCVNDPFCPCRPAPEFLIALWSWIQEGILTEAEAFRMLAGRQV